MKLNVPYTLGIAAAAAIVVVTGGTFAAGVTSATDPGTPGSETTGPWMGPGMMGPGMGPGMGRGMMGRGMGPGMMGGPGLMRGPGGMGGPGMLGPGMMSGNPIAYADQRLTRLKAALGITPQQESTWDAYAEAVKGQAGMMLAHRQALMGNTAITPEQRRAFMEQGQAQRRQVAGASRNLYAVLTPEQREKAGGLPGTGGWMR
jgi:hypothetical protein